MKILIYGNRGWIGNQFKQILNEKNIEYIEGQKRIVFDNRDEIRKEIILSECTHVICFIGRTHGKIGDKYYPTIDYLEQEEKLCENLEDNLVSIMILGTETQNLNIHFTYLGTGCIFTYKENLKEIEDFEKCYKFTEEDKPNFFGSSYSVMKGYTDKYVRIFPNLLNLRIRMPITGSNDPRNFITKITNYKKICSIPNSMTVLPELLLLIPELMEQKHTGTLNFTNPGVISHNEILDMYKKYVNPEFVWENFTIEEQDKILDSKRSNNYLDTTKLETLFPEIKNIKDSVEIILKNYKL